MPYQDEKAHLNRGDPSDPDAPDDPANPSAPGPVVVRHNPRHARLCRQLAERLGAPLVDDAWPPGAQFQVEVDEDGRGLALRGGGPGDAPLRLDFDRVRAGAGPDPLFRAVGPRMRTLVDATAGWGVDAVHLARRGLEVTAVEKNPVVAVLLAHAHAACRDARLQARLTIVHDDSVAYLRALAAPPDVVYLDPMYPPRVKSAAAKKPLVVLRRLTGAADHGGALFEQAMSRAARRVVVKRPGRAPPLAPGRVGAVAGKLVRFDIYRPRAG